MHLFEELGGEKKLGIALRTFRAVASGQIPPSLKFFSAIFSLIPTHMKKDALVSFFESSIDDKHQRSEMCSFVEEHMGRSINEEVESLWTQREPQYFSDRQLRFLASSNEVVRIYNRLVCHGEVSLEDYPHIDSQKILDEMVRLEIAQRVGRKFQPTKSLFRLPTQDNSPRELVAPASDFIVQHVLAFLAKEGAPGEQELGYSFHTCRKRDAEKILEQMRYFKRWVQGLGLTSDQSDEVGFVWVDFGRILVRGRDY
jgi:hypothetical protein